jgi:8-oxo-dGTP pyrophosphatase MutT (NUDIX family)
MSDSGVPKVLHVDQVDMRIEAKTWDFAVERRAQIDALFAQMRREKPALFNGRVLLMHRYTLDGGILRGHFLETDYASFVAWQRWGRPPAGIFDCFAAAAILAADGAYLLGLMGPHTFNAGQIYFPCGTPDPSDVSGGKVDFDFSVKRELREETGLDAARLTEEPGWSVVFEGDLICATKVLRSELSAEPLRARILETLAAEPQPELADIRIARGPADFDPAMRGFVKAFLAHRFGRA